jgi:predicted RNA-binding Zn ribbon-like protein
VAELELVANALCLDFTNTVNQRPTPSRDELVFASGLLRWAARTGLGPAIPPVDPRTARELREHLYAVFSAVARGAQPPDTELLMRTYAEAVAAGVLRVDGARFALAWPPPLTGRQILWRVAASAVRLLMEGPLERVGECPGCGWLFLDTSRNAQRRWCSMATCGARAKSARYYAKK